MDDSTKELLKHLQGLIKESAADVTMKLSSKFHSRSAEVELTVETLSNIYRAANPSQSPCRCTLGRHCCPSATGGVQAGTRRGEGVEPLLWL
jgi:hypothetical protein